MRGHTHPGRAGLELTQCSELGKGWPYLQLVTWVGEGEKSMARKTRCFVFVSLAAFQFSFLPFFNLIRSIFPRRYGRNLWLWHHRKQEIAFLMEFYYLWFPLGPGALLSWMSAFEQVAHLAGIQTCGWNSWYQPDPGYRSEKGKKRKHWPSLHL